ncbi:hypothetical protein PRUPE_8G071900 [Prunus persica]|uniref:Uncharacterized protein n=1 Tax=Prunus persica TaxID=3760 RepID=A0A251MUG0_PRUPE|nr:hypothetical protein PRUPE_8G071900 [Prunus persica]
MNTDHHHHHLKYQRRPKWSSSSASPPLLAMNPILSDALVQDPQALCLGSLVSEHGVFCSSLSLISSLERNSKGKILKSELRYWNYVAMVMRT